MTSIVESLTNEAVSLFGPRPELRGSMKVAYGHLGDMSAATIGLDKDSVIRRGRFLKFLWECDIEELPYGDKSQFTYDFSPLLLY